MSIVAVVDVVHAAFGHRPRYGSPYPEGIALGHADVVGDATGGDLTVNFNADGGFLYRLETVHVLKQSVAVLDDIRLVLISGWASQKSGLGTASFNITRQLARNVATPITNYRLTHTEYMEARRFPLGRTDADRAQLLAQFIFPTNTNTIVWDFNIVLTYWRKEATYLPGFLSSFYESPVVPIDISP